MIAYRIARREYIEDLSGYGAFLFGGRWNEQGVPALYLSSSLTLAMLEILVHASNENPPVNMYFAEVYVPDEIYEEPVVKLPQNQSSVTLGSEWLKSKKSLFIKVPSAILPYEYEHDFNLIFNPQHKDFKKLKVIKIMEIKFDYRLNKF